MAHLIESSQVWCRLPLRSITVSLEPFKSALETQYQKLSDALLLSMRRTASAKQKQIDDYVTASLEMLARRPQVRRVQGMGARSARSLRFINCIADAI